MKRNPAVASGEARCVVHDLPDDVLRLILLRLDSPLWLVRAACACKRWRRCIADGAFLRLARSLYPPVVVGHYLNYVRGFHRFVPSSPTPVRLSLDFFPREITGRSAAHHHTFHHWEVDDSHGGLILLREDSCGVVPDLVVCDPLSRRYRNIHHPPYDTSSRPTMSPLVFLLDGGDDDGNISLSNFRVLYCSTYSGDHGSVSKSKVYVFSTADGGDWRLVRLAVDHRLYFGYEGHVIGRIERCLYLASPNGDSVRVLDNASANARLELSESEVHLPTRVTKSDSNYSTFAVVHGGSPQPVGVASPATTSIVHVRGEDLEVFRRIPGSGEWVLQHSIPRLSEATCGLEGYPESSRWTAVDVIAGGTRLAVLEVSLSRKRGHRRSWFLSLDVDTMELQVVPESDVASYPSRTTNPKIYTLPWPQFLTALAS